MLQQLCLEVTEDPELPSTSNILLSGEQDHSKVCPSSHSASPAEVTAICCHLREEQCCCWAAQHSWVQEGLEKVN